MPRTLAAAIVLVSAGAVLVLEILALRLAAPYVGLTLDTYSAAIGVALLGIAGGAWAGGRLADRIDPRQTLGPTLVIAGGLVFLVAPITDWIGPELRGSGPRGALALVGAATAPAIVALSMAHPAVVKLRLAALEQTGATVGGLSAVGTLGALGGTFLTGFVLLGELGARTIVLGTGALVVALGIVASLRLRFLAPRDPSALAVALPALALLLITSGPCERETRHYCAQVVAAGQGRTLVLDDLFHSRVDPDRPGDLLLEYLERVDAVVASAFAAREPLRSLHVGGGGFAYPRYLAATRPGSRQTVLELDSGVVELARVELGLRTGPDLRVRVGDARMGILEQPAGAFDLVVGDAFASRSVPWHLTTREFLAQVRRVLDADGIYVMNLIDSGDLGFLRAELATLEAVFGNVGLLARTPLGRGNFILAASTAALPLAELRRRAARDGYAISDGAAVAASAAVLTDDFAPVDQLLNG